MSDESTRRLIEKLTTDLEPVTPIPGIPRTLAGVLAVVVFVAAVALVFYEPRPDLLEELRTDVPWASVAVGLVLAILGGCLGAFASVIPGREGLTRLGGGLALTGLLLALAASAAATSWSLVRLEHLPGQLACVLRGAVFAVLPAGMAVFLAARGWAGRPDLTVALALLGTGSAGALLVHLTCPAIEPLHLLLAHASTPIWIALLLTAALAPSMRRWAR